MVDESGELGKEQPQIWDYETRFSEYVLLLGRKGTEGLESIDNYPGIIVLDRVWHEPLEQMRSETRQDSFERYALIGSREHRGFYFPEIFAKGEPDSIPKVVWENEIHEAREKYKLSGISGEIHSHPDEKPFSPPDLFRVLNEFLEPQILIAGLVTTQENIFAFRTRETFTVTPLDMWPQSFPKLFENHWMENAGYRFNQDRSHVIPVAPSQDPWKVSLGIAEAHHLVLYRGKPEEDLIRVFP